MRLLAALAIAGLFATGAPVSAQDEPPGPRTPIIIIDQDRLFDQSQFGAALRARLEAEATKLAAENRQIEAELIGEERQLTEQRSELTVEEFRELADAFDEKVQRIRAEQDAKTDALTELGEEGRQQFLAELGPILSALARERGGLIMIDRRNVILSAESIDLTDEAIERIDAAIGDGGVTPEAPGDP